MEKVCEKHKPSMEVLSQNPHCISMQIQMYSGGNFSEMSQNCTKHQFDGEREDPSWKQLNKAQEENRAG